MVRKQATLFTPGETVTAANGIEGRIVDFNDQRVLVEVDGDYQVWIPYERIVRVGALVLD